MQPCLALPLFRRQAGRRRSWLSDNSRGKSTPAETCANRHAPALLIRNFPVVSSKTRYLIWQDQGGRIHQLPITRDLVIGSSPDCDIVLNAPGVAPRHCLIRHHPDADILVVLSASRGISINGKTIDGPIILRVGDCASVRGDWLFCVGRRRNERRGADWATDVDTRRGHGDAYRWRARQEIWTETNKAKQTRQRTLAIFI